MPLISASDARFSFLEDRELDPGPGLDRLQRIGEGVDDRRGRERIASRLEVGLPEQMAHPSVEELQLVVTEVLDHPRDVAGDDRLIHGVRVDERELVALAALRIPSLA